MDTGKILTRTARTPGSSRPLLLTFGWAWLLTTIGGGCCGLLAAGLTTISVFVFSIPAGLLLGATLGVPLSLGLAVWFARRASPPVDPDRFARQVETTGGLIALAINVPMNVATVVNQSKPSSTLFEPAVPSTTIVVLVLVACACIAGSAFVGRMCGYLLAWTQLKRFGIAPPDRLAPWTLQRPRQ